MSLSDRIRPNCEAAPWVLQEVIGLENELNLADSLHRVALRERDFEREVNRRLLDALHKISLAEADSTTSAADKVRDMARIARDATTGQ